MEYLFENKKLTLFFEGTVDHANADAIKASIDEILGKLEFDNLILDFEKLKYISSVGLRIILKLKKMYDKTTVINVSSDVYEIFEMTGFSEIMDIKKILRTISVDGLPEIGKGAKGTVYRLSPETAVKVFKKDCSIEIIENEIKLARFAFVMGIPTAIPFDIVKVGDSFGSVFELLDAKSFSKLMKENPEKTDEYAKMIAELLQSIHETDVSGNDLNDVKNVILGNWLKNSEKHLGQALFDKIKGLVEKLESTETLIHGDFHSNNLMFQNGEMLLIDMDSVSKGNPIFELANIYLAYVGFGLISHEFVENFIGISYEKTCEFFDKLMKFYFENKTDEEIKDNVEKTELIACLRLISHIERRGKAEEKSELIKKIAERIDEISQKFDDLSLVY